MRHIPIIHLQADPLDCPPKRDFNWLAVLVLSAVFVTVAYLVR